MRYVVKEQVVNFICGSLLMFIVGLVGMNTPVAHADDGCGGTQPNLALDQADSAEIVYRINLARRAEGLAPYKMSEGVMRSAAYHANDMVEDDYFLAPTHDVVNGELVRTCGLGRRIESFYGPLDTPNGSDAVNITLHSGFNSTVDEIVGTWLDLESIRGTLMASTLRQMGVGQEVEEGLAVVNTVAEYLLDADYFPLVINNEVAEISGTNSVELYVYGDWEEIRLRENGGAWSDWMPFSNEMTREFAPVTGENLIESEMRTGSLTTLASDTIIGVGYYHLVVDDGAVEMSDSNSVKLSVDGDWEEIRIRENGGAWSDWMPFSNEMTWDFTPLVGENLIEVEMRTGDVTASASDMIIGVEPTRIKLQENTASTNWLTVAQTMIALFSAGMVMLTVLAVVVHANSLKTITRVKW